MEFALQSSARYFSVICASCSFCRVESSWLPVINDYSVIRDLRKGISTFRSCYGFHYEFEGMLIVIAVSVVQRDHKLKHEGTVLLVISHFVLLAKVIPKLR